MWKDLNQTVQGKCWKLDNVLPVITQQKINNFVDMVNNGRRKLAWGSFTGETHGVF